MDLWFVAAAAGAGYLANYWQNLSQDKEGLSESDFGSHVAPKPESRPLIENIRDETCPFRKLPKRNSGQQASTDVENENLSDGRFMGRIQLDNPLSAELPSTNGFNVEKQEFLRKGKGQNLLTFSKYPTGFLRDDNAEESGDDNRSICDVGDTAGSMHEHSTCETGMSRGFRRGRSSFTSRRSHLQFLKPLNSLESCLMAQVYKERTEMEEYVLTPLPSPCTPTLRSLYVTDGRQIISKSSDESFGDQFTDGRDRMQNGGRPEANNEPSGVPHLPNMASAQRSLIQKVKKGNTQIGKLSYSNNLSKEVQFLPQGTSNGAVLFCLGISIGIITSIIANKMEVEKLRDLLKQTENLVQDLQEEIEMKDSLTVQELVDVKDLSQDAHDCSPPHNNQIVFSTKLDSKDAIKYANEESETHNAAEKLKSMTTIEAELEAELERLEMNMKEPTLHGRLPDVFELDGDFVAEAVQGDLRAEMVRRKAGADLISDGDSSSTATPHSAKYAVSPHELSLRLHQVIQSRLEERILELEAALEKSQKRVHHLESERWSSWREFVYSESSSTQCSPVAVEAGSPIARPLVMNLSGEVLNAYNEACEERGQIDVSTNEDSVLAIESNNQHKVLVCAFESGQEERHSLDKNKLNGQNGMARPHVMEEETWQDTGMTRQSHEVTPNDNGNSEDDDDDMVLLMKQIVEKTRRGSPAVLQAHKVMVSMDTEY
ncbi:hypothetical protein Ancab_038803 [Ancistrocladus abbreviatus]